VHFPELDRVRNHENYVKLVADYGDRDSIMDSGLLNSEMGLKKGIDKSIGAEIGESDLAIIVGFARSLKSLQESRKSITEYVDMKMGEIAPNLRDLCGYSLGAKLIAHVGSMKRLAMLPSSTVQIIGAEKALFRHLKTGENPPKHGLIYQHPDVRGAKWWIRGKIARALAAKISLAARKDVFSGEYDPSIEEGFEIKVKEIEKDNPFPKRSTASSKPDKKKDKKKRKKKEKYKKKISDYY
jgi:nucleolar protein 56